MTELLIGLGLVFVGLLIAIFSGSLAKISLRMNKELLSVELPFEWVRGAHVLIGALLSLSGVLILLGLPPL